MPSSDIFQEGASGVSKPDKRWFPKRRQDPPRLRPKRVERTIYTYAKQSLVDVCGIEDCIMDGGFHGAPLCEDHAWQVWATLTAVKESDDDKRAAVKAITDIEAKLADERKEARLLRESTWKTQRWIEPGWVYYLKVGDRIKIGYTQDLEQRMKQYPPHSELLATHPGTQKIEREMHHKFLHLLANGREWFTVEDELLAHIEKVRTDFKQIDLAA